MQWLNYHHLFYFWVVAGKGSVVEAARELRLRQPTVSAQLKQLEESLGTELFHRQGRRLRLSESGAVVFRYAEQIFALGRELRAVVEGKTLERIPELRVGVADALPKLVVYRLLEPVRRLAARVRMVCHEDRPERLLSELSLHNLDVVLSDAPLTPAVSVRAFNHLLGECDVGVYGTRALARKYKVRFPHSLEGAPLLLPTPHAAVRRSFEQWRERMGIQPEIVGEFDDSALLKIYGQAGEGLFLAPAVIDKEVREQYHVELVGKLSQLRERFFAITLARKLTHPAIQALSDGARKEIF